MLVLALLLAACGQAQGPRANRLHTVPFAYLSNVQLGMRERDLTRARGALERVAPNEYSETVASFGVIYVTLNGRLIGVVVPETFATDVAGKITFTQHQQEAYRSFGATPVCAYDPQENRRIVQYPLSNGVHEISLRVRAADKQTEITRSFLLVPSAQWRHARQQPC